MDKIGFFKVSNKDNYKALRLASRQDKHVTTLPKGTEVEINGDGDYRTIKRNNGVEFNTKKNKDGQVIFHRRFTPFPGRDADKDLFKQKGAWEEYIVITKSKLEQIMGAKKLLAKKLPDIKGKWVKMGFNPMKPKVLPKWA